MSKLIVTTVEAINVEARKIGYDSDTTGMTIDSDGTMLRTVKPVFYAVGSGTQSWSGSQNYQVLQCGTAQENIGGHYNTSTYTFTAPIPGQYYFWNAYCNQTNSSTGPESYIVRTRGGANTWRGHNIGYGDYYDTNYQGVIFTCERGDTVNVRMANNNNTSFTIDLGRSSFGGYLI